MPAGKSSPGVTVGDELNSRNGEMRAEIGPGMPKDQVSTPKEFPGQNAGLEMECN